MSSAVHFLPSPLRLPVGGHDRIPKAWLWFLGTSLNCRLLRAPSLSTRARPRGRFTVRAAYVSAPASDPNPGGIVDNPAESNSQPLSVEPSASISWGRIWSLLMLHKLRIAASIVSLVGCTTCTLSMPLFSGKFFEVLIGTRPQPLWLLLTQIGVLYALEPVFTVVFVINMNTMWEKVMAGLRAQVFRKILIQKVEFFDRYKVGELTGLVTSDLGSLKDIVGENISRDRGLRALSEVRSFGGERRQMSLFGNLVLASQASGIKIGALKSANETLTRVMIYISLLALYCLGGSKVKAGELSIGTMASFVGYTFTLTFAVQGVVNTLGDLRGTLAAVERINSVLSGFDIDESLAYGLEREIQKNELGDDNLKLLYKDAYSTNGGTYPVSPLRSTSNASNLAWSGDIRLEDVHFSYPLRPDVEVLSGLDLTLKCGTVTALVGSSGAGKSTIVQLLARFYEPTRGRITVGGEDVRIFNKREWAHLVSIVNQEPVLFSVSVGENIAYGLPDENVSKEDVVKAAKAANAHNFIISLPQGYDTLVGERGGLLSGGQRQRIAIARALLKNSPILILDEATSALDTVSEKLVQEALNQLMKGRTTLVIAHRLSTVQNADQIALCSSGRIAELGTHSELLNHMGQYASLVGTQRLAFE